MLPDTPTVGETLPGYEVVNWFGMVLPAGTPHDIIIRLNTEVLRALKLPDVHERLLANGAEPVGSSPEEFGEFMKAETAKWAKVIKEANIHAD